MAQGGWAKKPVARAMSAVVRRSFVGSVLAAIVSVPIVAVAMATTSDVLQPSVAGPTLTTDLPDYAPQMTVHVSGAGFSANTTYAIPIMRPNGTIVKGDGTFTPGWDEITSDGSGSFVYNYQLDGVLGTYNVRAYPATWAGNWTQTPIASVTFTDSNVTLDQCQNGGVSPLTLDPCQGSNWINGNANGNKAHWREGEFISYRATVSNITAGSHTLVFHYRPGDTGKHAVDYLGSFDATETTAPTPSTFHANQNDPCGDLVSSGTMTASECVPSTPVATVAVPAADFVDANAANCGTTGTFSGSQAAGSFKLFGPASSTLGPASYSSQNISSGGGCQTTVSLTFSVPSALSKNQDLVIAWGGHIATQSDWGAGNSASFINGSPYHMALDSLDGSSAGSQDRSLSTGAIFFSPAVVTTVENASNAPVTSVTLGSTVHDTTVLTQASSGAGGTVTYSLFDNGTCTSDANTTTQTVTVSSGTVPPSGSFTPSQAGSFSYEAAYSGDSGDAGATSACEPFTVGPAPTSVSTTVFDASTNTAWSGTEQTGASAYDTSSVSGEQNNVAPTGTISYTFFSNGSCAGTGSPAGTGLSLGTNSSTQGPLARGAYSFEAVYSGDNNYSGSTSFCEPFSVGLSSTSLSTTVLDASTHAPWSGTEQTGASAYDTSSVSGEVNNIAPTGTVSYTFYSNGSCSGTGSAAGTGLSLGTKSSTEGPLNASSYSFRAVYSGDNNYSGSTSSCEPFSVGLTATSVSTTVFDASTNMAWSGTEQAGTSAYDTSSVAGEQNNIAPTGTISYTFYSNGLCSGTGSPAGTGLPLGTGSSIEGPLTAASYSFRATYSGDSNYSGSTSSCEPFSVAQAPTSVSTTVFDASTNAAWSGTEQAGASAYDTSSVSGEVNNIAPGGTVSYTFFSNGSCSGPGSSAGSGLSLGSNSSTEGPLNPGSYSFRATYSGDNNYSGSTSSCEPFSLAQAQVSVSTTVFDASTNMAWSGTEQTGASAYDTSSISGEQNNVAPTGTISYTFFSNGSCSGPGGAAGTGLSLGTNSSTKGPLARGTYSFEAVYSGDSNYSGSTSQCEPFSLSQAPTSVSTTVFDAGTRAAWSGTEQTGASAYDTSSVSGEVNNIAPGGTVIYTFYSNGSCSGLGSSAGTGLPIGTKSSTEGPLATGNYAFRAVYSGDNNYSGSTSSCEAFSVGLTSTSVSTTVFDASTNAAWSGTEQAGASAYDTSSVSGEVNNIAPTGTISYTFYGNGLCSGPGSAAGTGLPLGTGSSIEGPLNAGSYSFRAAYSGDGNYGGSSSICEFLSVSQAPTSLSTTVFDASTNAAWSGTEQAGASAYDTSSVSGEQNNIAPGGTISYTYFTNGSCSGTGTTAGSGLALGTNSSTEGPLNPGSYSFRATYSGDSNYSGSTSPCESLSLSQAPTSVSTTVFDAATNTAWSGTEQTGASTYDTSSVSGEQNNIAPGGTISYTYFTNGSCSGTGSSAGTGLSLGSNSSTRGPLAHGSYSFEAVYSGDSNYGGSASPCEPFSVSQAPTSVSTAVFDAATHSAWSGTEQTGASAYDTSSVSGEQGNIAPGGTVSYTFYGNGSCSGPASAAGTGLSLGTKSSTEGPLTTGNYSFSATYSGNNNYSGSTSPCEPFSVGLTSTSVATTVFDASTNSAWSGTEQAGASAYDTSSVSGEQNNIAPGGTISYTFYGNGSCSGTGSDAGTGLSLGTNSSTEGPLTPGGYSFLVVYSGDSNYGGSSSVCEFFSVSQGQVSVSTAVFDAATNTAWSGTEQVGASAYDTSSVSGEQNNITPGGTISYTFFANGSCSGRGSTAGTGLPVGTNSSTEGPLGSGSYSFRAAYSGDSNYSGSTSPCEPFSLSQAPTSLSTTVFDAGTRAAWSGTEQTGASAYDTSSVSGQQANIAPGGTITYTFYGNGSCSSPGSAAGTGLSLGTKSSTEGPLATGSFSFSATYSGNNNYSGSTSACEPFSVGLTSTSVSTAVFDAATNATWSGTELAGASAYDTSRVSGEQNNIAPTGTISYTFYANNSCSGTGSDAGTGLSLGTNSSTEGPLSAGNYSFTAAYSGDGNYGASTSSCELFAVSVSGSGSGGGGGGPAPTLDHFLCYSAATTSGKSGSGFTVPTGIGISNLFSATSATPSTVSTHCNPAQKTLPNHQVTTITNPLAHLLCWGASSTKQSGGSISVTNQFGEAQLAVGQVSSLCLSSWKNANRPPNEPSAQPSGLDNFVCYPATYVSGSTPFKNIPSFVVLHDEFGTLKTKIGALTSLCWTTEVTINGSTTPVANPTHQLVCFAVTAKVKRLSVFDQNSFGTGRVSVTQAVTLCIPSA